MSGYVLISRLKIGGFAKLQEVRVEQRIGDLEYRLEQLKLEIGGMEKHVLLRAEISATNPKIWTLKAISILIMCAVVFCTLVLAPR